MLQKKNNNEQSIILIDFPPKCQREWSIISKRVLMQYVLKRLPFKNYVTNFMSMYHTHLAMEMLNLDTWYGNFIRRVRGQCMCKFFDCCDIQVTWKTLPEISHYS